LVAEAWGNRFNLNPDGVSYVEMARYAASGDLTQLISGYWSPGYPLLLLPIVAIVTASARQQIVWLHLINAGLLVAGAVWFGRMIALLPEGLGRGRDGVGYLVFAMIGVGGVGSGLLTPDAAVMIAVLVTAWSLLQLERGEATGRWSLVLGAALGAGYWLKGMMLPLALLLFALLWWLPPQVPRARALILRAAGIFAMIALPLVALVSWRVGHLSVGEVGRLNYAWEVDGVLPFVGWLGDSVAAHGRPVHLPHLLVREPETLTFAGPVPGFYPLWYDPSYWYAGVRARFDLSGEVAAIGRSLGALGKLLLGQWAVIAALVLCWSATAPATPRAAMGRMPGVLLLWSVGAAAAYGLVHVEQRYLAGFIATAAVAICCYLAARQARPGRRWVMPVVLALLAGAAGWQVWSNSGGFDPGYQPDYLAAAGALRQAGLSRGTPVAIVGDAFEAYAAFAAGVRITGQVVDSTAFWRLPADGRAAVTGALQRQGMRALLANNVPPALAGEGWRLVTYSDSTNLGVLILPAGRP
jgi:hypothetical protein